MPLRRLSTAAPGSRSLGAMRYRFIFYEPGLPGFDGGATPDSPVFTTWGDLRAARGQEIDRATQIAQTVDHVISIPYRRGVNENQIIGYQGRKFLVKYIEDSDESQWFLDVCCEEIGQNAGQGDTNWAPPPPPGAPPTPPPASPSSALQWTPYSADAHVAAGALVGVKADGGTGGITLTLEGQENELLYAVGVGTGGGLVNFVDVGGSLIGNTLSYDLSPGQTVTLAYTGGQWWVFGG